MYKGQIINEMKIFISKLSSASYLLSLVHLLISFFKGCYCQRYRQMGKMVGLKLSISSSQVFYKKIATSKIKCGEDLMDST